MICDFKKWLKNKISEDFENNPQAAIDNFSFNDEQPTDHDHVKNDLIKLITSKYNDQFMRFLHKLADETSDDEIINLSRKLKNNGNSSSNSWKARFASGKEQIVPPSADRGFDTNAEEE